MRGGGKPTVNYAASKTVAIKDATRVIKEKFEPTETESTGTRNKKRLLTRAEKVEKGLLDVDKFAPQYNKRYTGLKEISTINKKYRHGISNNIIKTGQGYAKFLRKWGGRRGAILAGGLLLGSEMLDRVLDS